MRAVAAIGGIALVSRLVYGSGFESYDPLWSLIWGRELIHGELPDLTAVAAAPTPHPLAIAVGALASTLGGAGPAALGLLSFVALGALGWAGFLLGRNLFGTAVGIGFALVVVTRGPVVEETLQALIDIPFLAFVVWAAALEAASPRRGLPVLALLGLAGLLRPEAWLLSAAYALYLSAGGPARAAARWFLAAAAAPLIWMAFDLLATGDPFHSLHGTQDLASLLGRPRGAETALLKLPLYLEFVLPEPLLWTGLAGVLLGLGLLYRESLLPAAVLGLGLLSFLVLGVAGLPLLYRYVFVPGLMLALFAVVALLGWLTLPPGRRRRLWSLAAIPVGALVVVLSAPGDVDRLRDASERAERVALSQRSQRELIEAPRARALLRRCPPIHVRSLLQRPALAYRLEVGPASITSRTVAAGGSAVVAAGVSPPGRRFRRLAGNAEWAVYASCRATGSLSSRARP